MRVSYKSIEIMKKAKNEVTQAKRRLTIQKKKLQFLPVNELNEATRHLKENLKYHKEVERLIFKYQNEIEDNCELEDYQDVVTWLDNENFI